MKRGIALFILLMMVISINANGAFYYPESSSQAVVVPEERAMQFEISGRSFLKKIRKLVGWNDDRPRMCYGEYIPSHQAIRFRLEDAQPVEIEAR